LVVEGAVAVRQFSQSKADASAPASSWLAAD